MAFRLLHHLIKDLGIWLVERRHSMCLPTKAPVFLVLVSFCPTITFCLGWLDEELLLMGLGSLSTCHSIMGKKKKRASSKSADPLLQSYTSISLSYRSSWHWGCSRSPYSPVCDKEITRGWNCETWIKHNMILYWSCVVKLSLHISSRSEVRVSNRTAPCFSKCISAGQMLTSMRGWTQSSSWRMMALNMSPPWCSKEVVLSSAYSAWELDVCGWHRGHLHSPSLLVRSRAWRAQCCNPKLW